MSEQGLSSIAVLNAGSGDLVSTITVTDIARVGFFVVSPEMASQNL